MTTGPQRKSEPEWVGIMRGAAVQQTAHQPQRPYFKKLYGQQEGGQPFSIPFSSPESFHKFAEERIETRRSVNKAADAAVSHIDTSMKYHKKMDTYGMTRETSEADYSGQARARDDKAALHQQAEEKIRRTLSSQQNMKLFITPEEHRALVTHSTDLNGTQFGSYQELRQHKRAEAASPAGSGHGSGLLDALRSGEKIENPARVIVDPDRLTQHEGHHRVEAVSEYQEESGEPQLIPVELHRGFWSSRIEDRKANIRRQGGKETTRTPLPGDQTWTT